MLALSCILTLSLTTFIDFFQYFFFQPDSSLLLLLSNLGRSQSAKVKHIFGVKETLFLWYQYLLSLIVLGMETLYVHSGMLIRSSKTTKTWLCRVGNWIPLWCGLILIFFPLNASFGTLHGGSTHSNLQSQLSAQSSLLFKTTYYSPSTDIFLFFNEKLFELSLLVAIFPFFFFFVFPFQVSCFIRQNKEKLRGKREKDRYLQTWLKTSNV